MLPAIVSDYMETLFSDRAIVGDRERSMLQCFQLSGDRERSYVKLGVCPVYIPYTIRTGIKLT